jgi:hypothetical protein
MHGISCSSLEWNLFASSVYYLLFHFYFGIPWKVYMKVDSYYMRCIIEMIGWIQSRNLLLIMCFRTLFAHEQFVVYLIHTVRDI